MQTYLRLRQILLLLWLLSVTANAQSPALRQLRDQLVATNGWRTADVVAVVSERSLNDTAQRLAGLEIKLASGAVMKLTTIKVELKPATALVQLGVQVDPTSKFKTAHFRLQGRLGSGEVQGANLRLPFQLTDVAFGTEESKSLSLMKLFLRDWLAPEKWNAVLPPLEIPLQLNPMMELPAATFEANGEMPMTIAMPAYQVKLDFTLAALTMLNGHAVIALNLQPKSFATLPAIHRDEEDESALLREIEQLTAHLTLDQDVRLRIRKSAINSLLAQLAAAREVDLTVQLKQGRLRAEEVDALVSRILNYTDVVSGEGKADIARLGIEEISDARVVVRLAGQGELNVQVKGREYGLPYTLSPRGRFSINDELLPLQLVTRNERILVRAAPGAVVPVKVNLSIDIAGHPIGLTRTVKLQAEEWLKDFELPAILTQEIQLPRKIVLDKKSELKIASSEASRYTIANLRIAAQEDALEISADIR